MPQSPISSSKSNFLVVGGGVVGLSLTWELARRGQSVSLVSSAQEELRSASWAGAGILPPPATKNIDDPYDRLRSISHTLHHQWAGLLLESTGIDTGFRKCGGIYLATTRAELATLVANEYWWQDHGIEFQRLDLRTLRDLEPNLQGSRVDGLLSAWLLPDECQLGNPRHLKALQKLAWLKVFNSWKRPFNVLTESALNEAALTKPSTCG
ncbi:MAG: FAD-dependent oxidoreductase [Pirellulales bacterium]